MKAKSIQMRQMSSYVAGLSFIWLLFVGSFAWAYLRVGKSSPYGGTPFKAMSWQERQKPNLEADIKDGGDEQNVAEVREKNLASSDRANQAAVKAEIVTVVDLESLNQKLYEKIDDSWQNWPTFDQNLVYRVMVSESGTIAQYQPLNQPAREYAAETPLPALQQPSSLPDKPAVEFTVVFTPNGILEVSP